MVKSGTEAGFGVKAECLVQEQAGFVRKVEQERCGAQVEMKIFSGRVSSVAILLLGMGQIQTSENYYIIEIKFGCAQHKSQSTSMPLLG